MTGTRVYRSSDTLVRSFPLRVPLAIHSTSIRDNTIPAMALITIPAMAPSPRWVDDLLLLPLPLIIPLFSLPRLVVAAAVVVDVTLPLLCVVVVTGVLLVAAGVDVDVVHVDAGSVTSVAAVEPAARVEPSGVQPTPPETNRPNIWGPQHHEPLIAPVSQSVSSYRGANMRNRVSKATTVYLVTWSTNWLCSL
jgi:hypothetical protein